MSYAEGEINIPLEEFWEFVAAYNPCRGGETVFGVPTVSEFDICVKFAYNSSCSPMDQIEKPAFMEEWKRVKDETACS